MEYPQDMTPSARRITRGDSAATILCYTGRRFNPIRVKPKGRDEESPDDERLYEVRIIDNDYNTYQEVIEITMIALDISEQEAYAVAWEVDHKGSCVVAHAPNEEAEAIAGVIRIIGIEVQVNPID
jgi:ATP-dependent Clp protease adapter protein ClpS